MRDVFFLSDRRLTHSACLIAALFPLVFSDRAAADESGVSFWLQGRFGSFAAAPSNPGLSFESTFYHAKAAASPSLSFVRGGGFSDRHKVAYRLRHGDSDICVRDAGPGRTSGRRNDGLVRTQHHLRLGNADRAGGNLAVGKPLRPCPRIRRLVSGRSPPVARPSQAERTQCPSRNT